MAVPIEQAGLTWQSLAWQDGTKYHGLTRNGKMHSHGILTFPNKDRYEGEFEDGKMHGSGVYVWNTGMIYRGDWHNGVMHGCGTRLWKQPDGSMAAVEGKFFADDYVGDIMPCSRDDAFDSAVEADMAAYQARSFQWPSRHQPKSQVWQPHASKAMAQQPQAGKQLLQQPQQVPGSKPGSQLSLLGGDTSAVAAASEGHWRHGEVSQGQQQERLQSLVQRLVADRMADHKRVS